MLSKIMPVLRNLGEALTPLRTYSTPYPRGDEKATDRRIEVYECERFPSKWDLFVYVDRGRFPPRCDGEVPGLPGLTTTKEVIENLDKIFAKGAMDQKFIDCYTHGLRKNLARTLPKDEPVPGFAG